MTESEYKMIWDDTQKAMKYLHKKGCISLCDSIPTTMGKAELLCYRVAGADEKAKAHVAKKYHNALIHYVERFVVAYGQLERDFNLAQYRMNPKNF